MALEKTYNSKDHEDQIYKMWEEKKLFKPEVNPDGEPYTISLPPPNATGVLHLGHATMLAVEDIMIRFHRMKGDKTLWLPGTDHAGIATQTKVEKLLMDTEGKTREELGREEFLQRVKEFVAGSQDTIRNQVRKMGASVDWDRERYTFEDALNRWVNEVFVMMYNDGLIYRGNRLINWSIDAQSVLADDELEWDDRKEPFYLIRCGEFVIGTVRPETKCADSPVVVNPEGDYVRVKFTDSSGKEEMFILSKYLFEHESRDKVLNGLDSEGQWEVIESMKGNDLVGQAFEYETYAGMRKFHVIADEVIDIEKGTGAMTISSSHSADDYDLAKRRGLDETFIEKIDMQGHMTSIAGPMEGKTIMEARKGSAKLMKEKGLIVGEDTNYTHRVPLCYRTDCVVEPMISKQWFVDVNKKVVEWPSSAEAPAGKKGKKMSLKEVMQDVVNEGDVEIIPNRFNKTYFAWIDNLRDWCISRQIWWGHRIPVWYRSADLTTDGKEEMYVGVTAPGGEGWKQDEDSLDTWFSSGLWTWSTLLDKDLSLDMTKSMQEVMEQSPDFKTFHPTNVLETGYDILFFWVARMILMTTYAVGEIPFKKVYLHGLVRDKHGKKMSKSKGNGIDPLDVIEQYGADAVRVSLVMGTTPGNDNRVYHEKIEANRNFVNKLWNISRFILMKVENPALVHEAPTPVTLSDKWILSRMQGLIKRTTDHVEDYRFSAAGEELFVFTTSELADWYVEDAKNEPSAGSGQDTKDDILLYLLTTLLKLWQPYMPYVTEVIWQQLNPGEEHVITAQWPQVNDAMIDQAAEAEYGRYQELMTALRNIRGEFKIAYSQPLVVVLIGAESMKPMAEHIKHRVKLGELTFADSYTDGGATLASHVSGGITAYTKVEGLIDMAVEKERLQKELDETQSYIDRTEKKLSNKGFVDNAPEDVVAQQRASLEDAKNKATAISGQLESLS